MPISSAGVLLFRTVSGRLEVLLIHPGGPFWRRKNAGAWQIPKGKIEAEEDALTAARREAEEELGIALSGTPVPLARIRQAGGKWVEAFALEQDIDITAIKSNVFEMEWPPRSGKLQTFPEVDAARWLSVEEARGLILKSQEPLLDALVALRR